MTIIVDGTGTGNSAKVTDNRVQTNSISGTLDQHINTDHQKYFSLPFDAVDPVAADDYFLYIKNTGTKDLQLTDIRMRSTVIGTVEVRAVSGTPSYTADADITPVNRTVGNSNTITAIIKSDTDTTGLVNEGIIFYMRLAVADTEYHIKTSSNIVIPPGQAISLLWDTSTGALSGVVSILERQTE